MQKELKTDVSLSNQGQTNVFSGSLVVRDKTGKFIPGHKKLGGRIKGSINFNTKLMVAIENASNIENYINDAKVAKALIRIAIEGKDTPSLRVTNYLFNMIDGPLGRKKRGWEYRI